jgi:hypothetical protein
MQRRYVDTNIFESRNMLNDGNIDNKYWHNKTHTEKLRAAATMISAAFGEPDFLKRKIDRTIFSARKHSS